MNPFASFASTRIGSLPTSIGATQDYIDHHLRSSKEAGDLTEVVGYLGRDGKVVPRFHNPAVWRQVGLTEAELKEGIIPPELIFNLIEGKDRQGRPLGRRSKAGFHGPRELLITVPCEVSQAMARRGSGYGLQLLEAMSIEALRQLEQGCTRVSRGSRKQNRIDWIPGETLALVFTHATERSSPSLPHHHSHILIFGQVRTGDGTWRALQHPRSLHPFAAKGWAGCPRKGDA